MKRIKLFEEFINESERIKKIDLIKKLIPLNDRNLKINNNDIKTLFFAGTKAEMNKVWKALGEIGVQQYFDGPLDDSEYSGKGTWYIDAQYAVDNDIIYK